MYSGNDLARPGAEPVSGFRLRHRLGRGTLGEVWKAETAGGFQVALKFIRLSTRLADASELRALQIVRAIRHPNLLVNFDAWMVDGYLILGMELADRTLWDCYLQARAAGLPGIPREELLAYLTEAARGLDHLNQRNHRIGGRTFAGVPHRHVKPQNILLFGDAVKVADFGLSRLRNQGIACSTGPRSFAYAAPEFFRSQTTRQSDQYCLAVTYCHMRGGRVPFVGSAGEMLAGHLLSPPDLSMLPEAERPALARALAKQPSDRWPSCGAFVAALSASAQAAELPALPAPTEPPERVPPAPATSLDARREPVSAVDIAAAFEAPVDCEAPAPSRPRVSTPSWRTRGVSTALLFLATVGLALCASSLVLPNRSEADRNTAAPTSASLAPRLAQASIALADGRLGGDRGRGPTPARLAEGPVQPAALPPPKIFSEAPPPPELPSLPEDVFASLIEAPAATPAALAGAQLSPNPLTSFDLGEAHEVAAPRACVKPSLDLSLPDHVAVESGKSAPLEITVRREGFAGPVSIRFEQAPEGVTLEPLTVARDADSTQGTLAAATTAEPGVREVRAVGVAGELESVTTVRVEVRPDPAQVHTRRGHEFFEAGDYERAIAELTQVLQLRPNDAVTYSTRGLAYHRTGQLEQAIADYSQALELEPADALSANNRGLAYRELGRYEKAIADYTEAIRLKPGDPVVRFNRGMAFSYAGDDPNAIADFTAAIRLRPLFAEAYKRRGDAHARRGETAAAQADHDTASRLAGPQSAAKRNRRAAAEGE